MKENSLKAFLYLAPALLLALLFCFIPLGKAFIGSFLTISQQGRILGFAGLDNYISLFQDQAFLSSVKHTLLFTVLFLPLNTAITLLAATLLKTKRRFTAAAEYIFITPLAFSLSALALIFKEIFRGNVSIINRIFGLSIAWLDEGIPAMIVLVILGIFLDFAFDYLLLLSQFRGTDKSIIEAAEIDGASGLTLFFRIELPAIQNMLSAVIFMALKDAVMISAPVMVLTEGGPFRSTETIMYYYYLEAFRSGNRAAGTTIAVLMVLFSILIMSIISRRRRDV